MELLNWCNIACCLEHEVVKLSYMYSTCITLGIQTGFCYVDAYIALLNGSVVFHLHHMVIILYSSSWPTVILWSHYRSHIYMGFMPEDWLHHNISVPCPVQCNLMCTLNFEISCNDISFNFNSIMVVMYGTSAERCVQ